MRLTNSALVGLASLVSVATAATILALDHAGHIRLAPEVGFVPLTPEAEHTVTKVAYAPQPAPISVPAPQPAKPRRSAEAADRAAPVPPEPVDLTEPSPREEPSATEDPTLRATTAELETTESLETTNSWLVDVQPEEAEASDESQFAEEPSSSVPQPQRASKPQQSPWSKALEERLAEISPGATRRLWKKFQSANAAWPPSEIALIAIKDEKLIELFARPEGGEWQFVHRYPVLAASGGLGPKLRQGDKQVPEGVYRISLLNPKSRYHVSLRVNYPNEFDREKAKADGRTNLGGDIMIHGKAASAGCLAVGDEAAEELFVLAAHVGLENIKLVIAPTDLRRRSPPSLEGNQPKWLPELYTEVATAMSEFKSPPRISLLSLFWN